MCVRERERERKRKRDVGGGVGEKRCIPASAAVRIEAMMRKKEEQILLKVQE